MLPVRPCRPGRLRRDEQPAATPRRRLPFLAFVTPTATLAASGLEVFPCGMGHLTLSPLVTELEKLILLRRLHHGGHPILRAAVDAVDMELDSAGNRKPSAPQLRIAI